MIVMVNFCTLPSTVLLVMLLLVLAVAALIIKCVKRRKGSVWKLHPQGSPQEDFKVGPLDYGNLKCTCNQCQLILIILSGMCIKQDKIVGEDKIHNEKYTLPRVLISHGELHNYSTHNL